MAKELKNRSTVKATKTDNETKNKKHYRNIVAYVAGSITAEEKSERQRINHDFANRYEQSSKVGQSLRYDEAFSIDINIKMSVSGFKDLQLLENALRENEYINGGRSEAISWLLRNTVFDDILVDQ